MTSLDEIEKNSCGHYFRGMKGVRMRPLQTERLGKSRESSLPGDRRKMFKTMNFKF